MVSDFFQSVIRQIGSMLNPAERGKHQFHRLRKQIDAFCSTALDCSPLSQEDEYSQEQVLKGAVPINS